MGTSRATALVGLIQVACGGLLPESNAARQAKIDRDMAAIREDTRQRQLAEEQRNAERDAEAQAEMTRITNEARDREHARKRTEACMPKWRAREIEHAKNARLLAVQEESNSQPGVGIPAGIPNAPSARHKLFGRYAATLEKQLAIGCEVRGREDFEVEWAYLQEQEASRVARLKEHEERVKAQNAEREAQRAAFEEDFTRQARKRGFENVDRGNQPARELNRDHEPSPGCRQTSAPGSATSSP